MTHVLLVDDDRVILNLLAEGLRAAGYAVSTASSADEALALAAEHNFDFAVLDMCIPEVNGLELARRFAVAGGPPFGFLSAYGTASVVQDAADAGAMGYLVKPVDVPQLIPFIEAAIARAREIGRLRAARTGLENALSAEQTIRVAVGIVMTSKSLDRAAAFEFLRSRARSERRKLALVAEELVNALESTQRLLRDTPPAPDRSRTAPPPQRDNG